MLEVGTFLYGRARCHALPVQSWPPLGEDLSWQISCSLKQPISVPMSKAISACHQHLHVQGGPIPHEKNWRRPLMVRQPYSVAVRAPSRSGYIPLLLRRRGLGGRGGAFLNGKEGRVGFRKNVVELPLERETEGFEKSLP